MQGPFIKSSILKITLGIGASLIALIMVLLVGVTEETRMQAQTANWEGREIETGAVIFANSCASCHGPDGRGAAGPALNSHYFFTERLDDVEWGGSLEDYVALTVAAGRPSKTGGQWTVNMPTWGAEFGGPFRADQVAAVTAYVLNWEETALEQTAEEDPWIPFQDVDTPPEMQSIDAPEPSEAAAEGEEDGAETEDEGQLTAEGEVSPEGEETAEETRDPEQLFQAMACSACHNLEAPQTQDTRGAIGPNFGNLAENAATRVEGLSAQEYAYNSIVAPNDHIVEGYSSGTMPTDFDEQMTEEEIRGLVDWLLNQSQ